MNRHIDGSTTNRSELRLAADAVIVGAGAGGSITAARLASAGLRVVVVEEGPKVDPEDFTPDEAHAYANLYQEAAGRATADGAIRILQGKSVGGGTTVNWMTSLRVPESTLQHWTRHHSVSLAPGALTRVFEEVENRIDVHLPDERDISPSNRALQRGTSALGWKWSLLPRNTRACTNIGLCGMGCPIHAKRTATLTFLADATAAGATILSRARVSRLVIRDRAAVGVEGTLLDGSGKDRGTFRVDASRVIVAGGAINTPALLIRSGLSHPALGKRTWLHPVVPVLGEYEEPIEPWKGSPQSIASDEFFDRGGEMGFFIETPPIYPVNAAAVLPVAGAGHRQLMEVIPYAVALINLCIDGFHESEPGGRVEVDRHGRIRVHYPIVPRLQEALRAAMVAAAKIHLAAGARVVRTLHNEPVEITSESELPRVADAPVGANRLTLLSAHPMGGCAMGDDRRRCVVDSSGHSHDVENLWVADGSLFPTSLGVNPMLTIYAVSALVADSITHD